MERMTEQTVNRPDLAVVEPGEPETWRPLGGVAALLVARAEAARAPEPVVWAAE
jgi:hypothetical protein